MTAGGRGPDRVAPSGMDAHTLSARLRTHAEELGLAWMGVVPAQVPVLDVAAYRRWIDADHHGEMDYLARPDAVARRAALHETLPGVRSVVVVAEPYPPGDAAGIPEDPSLGVVARVTAFVRRRPVTAANGSSASPARTAAAVKPRAPRRVAGAGAASQRMAPLPTFLVRGRLRRETMILTREKILARTPGLFNPIETPGSELHGLPVPRQGGRATDPGPTGRANLRLDVPPAATLPGPPSPPPAPASSPAPGGSPGPVARSPVPYA